MGKKTVKTSLPTDRTMYKLIQALKDAAVYPEVIDNLNSDSSDQPLSAKQGKVLKNTIDAFGFSVVDGKLCQTYSD